MQTILCPDQIELNSRPKFKFDCYSGLKLLSNYTLGNITNSDLINLLLNFESFDSSMKNNHAMTESAHIKPYKHLSTVLDYIPT